MEDPLLEVESETLQGTARYDDISNISKLEAEAPRKPGLAKITSEPREPH